LKVPWNFRNEREHDERFMTLIRGLDQANRLDLLEQSLNLPPLGRLRNIQRRRAFDVEAGFETRRLLVETKVDSDEGGRWDAVDDPAAWQTNQIAAQARDGDVCLFVTYGFAEFFTKWFDFGAAAGALRVRHVKLDEMVVLVANAEPVVRDPSVSDWLAILRAEQRKRVAVPTLLSAFADFRRTYLQIEGDVDFTLGRIGFNAPEIAFQAFARLVNDWRDSQYSRRYGRLALYPVGRLMLPVDSVLNWWELWHQHAPLTVGGILPEEMRALYIEVNEDFNIHLKLAPLAVDYVNRVRDEVARQLGCAARAPSLVACRPEFHVQGAHAVWEWDVDLPALIYKGRAIEAIGTLLDSVIPVLK
jgi:hypothetical protein